MEFPRVQRKSRIERISPLNIRNMDYEKTTHKSNFEPNYSEKYGDDEKCYREIVMVVLNLKRAASATAKSEKAKKFTAQTAQPI